MTFTISGLSGYPTVDLQPGNTGSNVVALQSWLVKNGFLTQAQMNSGPGIYGPQTTAAVASLQNALGVNAGANAGDYGPLTRAAIQAELTTLETPVLTTQTNGPTWTIGQAVNFTLPSNTFTDPQNESLTYTATLPGGTPLPSWLSFNGVTRTFTGTVPGVATTFNIQVTVTDTMGLSASETFGVTIPAGSPPPVAPSVSRVSPSPVPASNSTQSIRIFGSNFQNGDTLTFTDKEGGVFSNRTPTFVNSGELDYQFNDQSDTGSWTVQVKSADGSLQSNLFSFQVAAASGTVDLYHPYTDATPGQPTVTDLVNAAKSYIGTNWGAFNCTGLIWAISDAVGADYYETAGQVAQDAGETTSQVTTIVPDPGNPPTDPATPSGFPGYMLPSSAGTYGQWTTFVSTTSGGDQGWTADVKIGDVVRIPANVLPDGEVHSFIVVDGNQQSGWEVIDNTDPSGGKDPVTISEHTFNVNPNNTFYQQVLQANFAYISRLTTSAPSVSFTVSSSTVTEGNDLTFQVSVHNPNYALTSDYRIYYATSNGTATAGTNYTAESGALDFTSSSAQTFSISVPTQDVVNSNGSQTLSFNIYDNNHNFLTSTTGTINDIFVDTPPVISFPTQSVSSTAGQSLAASNLFSASDGDGDQIAQYDVWSTDGVGHWVLGSQTLAAGQDNFVPASQLGQLSYQVGAGTDTLWVRANDGSQWGGWRQFTVTAPAVNTPPVISFPTQSVSSTAGQSLAATNLFSASDGDGDQIAQYDVWSTDGVGHWVLGSQTLAAGQDNFVPASQLGQLSYQVGAGTDTLWVRANDGSQWGGWRQFTVTAPAVNTPPVISFPTQSVSSTAGQSLAATNLFSASDGDGDQIAQYDVWSTDGVGHWVLGSQTLAAGQDNFVPASQLGQLSYQVGAGTDTLWVRANDGSQWGSWRQFTVSSTGTMAGFDESAFPGMSIMNWLSTNTDLMWCGYYLDGPNHPVSSWLGTRAELAGSWALAPIYVGEQDTDVFTNARAQGVSDADSAAGQMGTEGFSLGSIVFLDIENGQVGSNELAYADSWSQEIRLKGYTPGIYAPGSDFGEFTSAYPNAQAAIQWVADYQNASNYPSSGTTNFSDPGLASVHPQAAAWQYDAEFGTPGNAGYHPGFYISNPFGTVGGTHGVDLDVVSTSFFTAPSRA